MMGVMRQRTQRLRIGTGVSLAPFYNPLWTRLGADAASTRGGRRAAEWMLAAYVGGSPAGDPTEYSLEDVPCSATAALGEAGMTYLMPAPLSQRSFSLLTDKVVPRVAARAAIG